MQGYPDFFVRSKMPVSGLTKTLIYTHTNITNNDYQTILTAQTNIIVLGISLKVKDYLINMDAIVNFKHANDDIFLQGNLNPTVMLNRGSYWEYDNPFVDTLISNADTVLEIKLSSSVNIFPTDFLEVQTINGIGSSVIVTVLYQDTEE